MDRATFSGNEVKSKMKQPSDMPMLRLEQGGSDLWSNMLLLDKGGTLSDYRKRHLNQMIMYLAVYVC